MSAALGTLENYSHGVGKGLSHLTSAVGNWLGDLFGCQHREMSRPFSRQGESYRVCISCGARRKFDGETWVSSGRHYFKPARTADLLDIDKTALRCVR
jgi:hypothetical protein